MRAKAALGVVLAGVLLLALLVAANELLLPPGLQTVGHLLHRLAYLVVLPLNVIVGTLSPPRDHHWPWFNWVIVAFATPLLAWLLGRALGCLRRRAPASSAETAPGGQTRRAFLRRGLYWGGLATGAAIGGYPVLVVPQQLQVRRYRLRIEGLPGALDGLRLVQLSDTHYGPFVPLPFIEHAVERARSLQPDLVLLTGDYVHRTPRAIERGIGALGRARGRMGVVAVLGNHDHWEGAAACRRALESAGISLVENTRRFVTPAGLVENPRGAPALCVAGVGDLWEDRVSVEDALGEVDAHIPRLLLSHNPDVAEGLPRDARVDLMLCGHTHGGQVRLPGIGAPLIPSRFGQKYAGGVCQGPRGPVLVSRGVGLTIVPVRLGVPPEISLIELHG